MISSTRTDEAATNSSSSAPLLLERQHDPLPPQMDHTIRFVILSDTHGRHDNIPLPLPAGDVLVHLGDIADKGNLQDIRSFARFLDNQPHPCKVIVQGNHDRNRGDGHPINLDHEFDGKAIVLKDEVLEIPIKRSTSTRHGPGSSNTSTSTVRVFGISWDTCEQDAFHTAIDYMVMDDESSSSGIDILLTHGNPATPRGGHGWRGSSRLTQVVTDHRIPLHLFGHVHWGRGIQTLKLSPSTSSSSASSNSSIMVNCATTWNQPVVIDFDYTTHRPVLIHCPTPTRQRTRRHRPRNK
jgi:calcineurin-like phosphoesterase family protein